MVTRIDIINWLDFSPGIVDVQADANGLSALKQYHVRQIKSADFGVDAVYFSGEFPSVYFKSVPDFQEKNLQSLLGVQQKIWNQGKVPFLYAESPTEIRIYNCFAKPQREVKNAGDIELFSASKQVKADLDELKTVFGKASVETGGFWKNDRYAKRVKTETRVDKSLIGSLKNTRAILLKKELPKEVIHDLLLRSLFLLYLEDRGATDELLYEGHKGYYEALFDKASVYKVYEKLDRHFNGNLCPVSDSEKRQVSQDHLREIQNCFWDVGPLFPNWRFYDFRVIPIQLISEIYEHFLADEIGTEEKNASGTFYTPLPLAEFVLNEVLPHASAENQTYNVKILDPTCGSGIFLVESLNRLLDRWELAHIGEKLDFNTICRIVKDNIFGIEKEKEAIKVTAFSIYLAMLDRLDPKSLWQNQRFPYLIDEPDEPDAAKRGQNLFRMSSLDVGKPFENIAFDLVVGNPPFGGRQVKPDVRAYLEKHKFGNETVEAFLHRATELCPKGNIALISTSKVLFNTSGNHQNFRHFLFSDCYVEKVFNFSILRRVPKSRGRNLFDSTSRPICVFFYSKTQPHQPSERLQYCAPTTVLKNRMIDGIAIDPTDVKFLPREACRKPDSKIWKAAMWGTERDYGLIRVLESYKTLNDIMDEKGWEKGRGFEISNPLEYTDFEIKNIPFISPEKATRFFTTKEKTDKIARTGFRRLGNRAAYKAPHVIIKKGQSDSKFCSSFLDYDCSFGTGLYGIHKDNEEVNLKVITGFLNSRLAEYLMLLLTGNWGIEREQFMPTEILNLPDLCFSLPEAAKKEIVGYVDEIIAIRKQEPEAVFLDIEKEIAIFEQKIENAFRQALNLSETDQILIDDLLNYQLDAFQSGEKSTAFRPCEPQEMQAYAQYLCKTINEFLVYTPEATVWATVFEPEKRLPLNVVALQMNRLQPSGTIQTLRDTDVGLLLKELEQFCYQEYAESIYFRKFIRYYKNDVLYILKPNEKRFWSRSMGLNDADEIILELLTAENGQQP